MVRTTAAVCTKLPKTLIDRRFDDDKKQVLEKNNNNNCLELACTLQTTATGACCDDRCTAVPLIGQRATTIEVLLYLFLVKAFRIDVGFPTNKPPYTIGIPFVFSCFLLSF